MFWTHVNATSKKVHQRVLLFLHYNCTFAHPHIVLCMSWLYFPFHFYCFHCRFRRLYFILCNLYYCCCCPCKCFCLWAPAVNQFFIPHSFASSDICNSIQCLDPDMVCPPTLFTCHDFIRVKIPYLKWNVCSIKVISLAMCIA